MAYEQRDNTGTLFRNEEKDPEVNPNHADYKGDGLVNGKKVWINAWVKEVKEGKNAGKKFFSISFKEKTGRQAPGAAGYNSQKQDPPPPSGEDIPF